MARYTFESKDQIGFEGLNEGTEVVSLLAINFSDLRSQLDQSRKIIIKKIFHKLTVKMYKILA